MSDLVGNPEDRFSRVAAQIVLAKIRLTLGELVLVVALFATSCVFQKH